MSEQSQRPTTDDRRAWATYWEAQGMPWRTEPEIAVDRRQFLAEHRTTKPNFEEGLYPFIPLLSSWEAPPSSANFKRC
jgi:hypothetical protein